LQTWPDVEVIVVDDGSAEELEPVIARARRECGLADRLKYVRQEHRGAGSARNAGVRHAAGEFVQFLDSDDLLHPHKLAVQIQHLRANPALDMVFCLDEQFKEEVGDLRILWNVPERVDCPSYIERFLHEDAVWQTNSPLWRRAALGQVGEWSEELTCWQDWEFHMRALCAGIRYECVPQVLNYIRHHDGVRSSWKPGLLKEKSCLRAGGLAQAHLMRAGLLNDRLKSLLLLYHLRHLQAVSAITEPGARPLMSAVLATMHELTGSQLRQTAIMALSAVHGTRLFPRLLDLHLFFSRKAARASLRNTIRGGFLAPPPDCVKALVTGAERFSKV
jgi:glycosyltransferase involved in cell wall biosynthesis